MTVCERLSYKLHYIYIPDQQRHPNARAVFISSFCVTRILLGNWNSHLVEKNIGAIIV